MATLRENVFFRQCTSNMSQYDRIPRLVLYLFCWEKCCKSKLFPSVPESALSSNELMTTTILSSKRREHTQMVHSLMDSIGLGDYV